MQRMRIGRKRKRISPGKKRQIDLGFEQAVVCVCARIDICERTGVQCLSLCVCVFGIWWQWVFDRVFSLRGTCGRDGDSGFERRSERFELVTDSGRYKMI